MATDTIPAAVPGPDEAPGSGTTNSPRPGLLASALAPVDPARPDFDLAPETAREGASEAPVQSASGGSSASYHGTDETPQNSSSNTGNSIQKQGIWRAWLLAGATRWGKGGGAVNKRLDLAKARAQSRQVKEARQVTVNRSGGLLGRNSAGSGGAGASGGKSLGNKGGSNGAAKGPKSSNGNAHGSAGHGPAGRSGSGGGSGSGGSGGGGRGPRGGGSPSGNSGGHSPKPPKGDTAGRSPKLSKGDGSKSGTSGGSGGKNGAKGPSGSAGKNGTGGNSADEKAKGPKSKDSLDGKSLEKNPKGSKGAAGAAGTPGKGGAAGKDGNSNAPAGTSKSGGKDTRTPLEKSRETGHSDGTKARRLVDRARAYADGVKDGWGDERDKNAKEHDRLDKAHAEHKAKLQGVTQGQTVQIEDDDEPMEDPFMSQATPIQAQGIDAKKITLGEGFLKSSVTRGELRTFKGYEARLEARIDGLSRIAESTKTLAAQAREQADDCQKLAESAKGFKGGEKLVGELQKLADQAKAQASEADEIHKRAAKAHDFAKAVLSNVQTRYAPLYQAVVDSDETKPAELKFYADRGVVALAA